MLFKVTKERVKKSFQVKIRLTDAVGAVAGEAGSAVAFVAAEDVDAAGIARTDGVASFALVDI